MYEDNELVENWSADDMCQVLLKDDDSFLKIKETLSRIGIGSIRNKKKILYPSCHILHKKGNYFIVHFKELFALDGKRHDLSIEDLKRRNAIVSLLEEWNLLDKVNKDECNSDDAVHLRVLKYSEKAEWEIIPKYNIGNN